jgi:hypothetical protein
MTTPTPKVTDPPPTKDEKSKAIEHVVYEYANLMAAAFHAMRETGPVRTHSDDAFLLGYRKLGNFLLNDDRVKDDVLALDYLAVGSTRTWGLVTWSQEWRSTMNKQLTHITYERVRQPKIWDHRKWTPKLEREFRDAWKMFWDAVIDTDFKAEYDKQISICRGKRGFANIVL